MAVVEVEHTGTGLHLVQSTRILQCSPIVLKEVHCIGAGAGKKSLGLGNSSTGVSKSRTEVSDNAFAFLRIWNKNALRFGINDLETASGRFRRSNDLCQCMETPVPAFDLFHTCTVIGKQVEESRMLYRIKHLILLLVIEVREVQGTSVGELCRICR